MRNEKRCNLHTKQESSRVFDRLWEELQMNAYQRKSSRVDCAFVGGDADEIWNHRHSIV
jgi:hypothetical protein